MFRGEKILADILRANFIFNLVFSSRHGRRILSLSLDLGDLLRFFRRSPIMFDAPEPDWNLISPS